MSRTFRNIKGEQYPDKSEKKKADRKQFVHHGQGWSTKAQGGVGNKRGWPAGSPYKVMPQWKYLEYKEKDLAESE